MTRIPQPRATKGSQKWLQSLVTTDPARLQPTNLPPLDWLSPLAADDVAEYRDDAFLQRLGLEHHAAALAEFWPARGPVWDGLARNGETVVLVEAKAHVAEALSSPSAASSEASQAQIAAAFGRVKADLSADDRSDWSRVFYQYANRLAHLWFLRQCAVDAHLLFVSVLGDTEVGGPTEAETWQALYAAADHALGLPARHALRSAIHHVHPRIG